MYAMMVRKLTRLQVERCWAIYIRKSRKDRDQANARLRYQRTILPEMAKKQGWKYVIYDEDITSACFSNLGSLKERERMLADVAAGKVEGILVLNLDRLSRDDTFVDFINIINLCAKYGVQIATP